MAGNKDIHRIFISGAYRSGTTLITRILNNHSKLWITYDSVHFMRFSYDKYNPITRVKNADRLVREIRDRISRRWDMDLDSERVIAGARSRGKITYAAVYDRIMADLAARYKPGAKGWGEKTNVCWGQMPNFLKMFKDGKVIHVIRDPRDVLCSFKKATYEPGFRYLDSAFCCLNSFIRAEEFSEILGPDRHYVLKYEDLLNRPEKEVRSVCEFLGIKYEPSMIDPKAFTDRKGNKWSGNSAFEEKIETITTKPVGRWKKLAGRFEIFFVEMINRDYMARFGYELSGIDAARSEWSRIYDIVHKDKLLCDRYRHWLSTGNGVEAFPSNPLKK